MAESSGQQRHGAVTAARRQRQSCTHAVAPRRDPDGHGRGLRRYVRQHLAAGPPPRYREACRHGTDHGRAGQLKITWMPAACSVLGGSRPPSDHGAGSRVDEFKKPEALHGHHALRASRADDVRVCRLAVDTSEARRRKALEISGTSTTSGRRHPHGPLRQSRGGKRPTPQWCHNGSARGTETPLPMCAGRATQNPGPLTSTSEVTARRRARAARAHPHRHAPPVGCSEGKWPTAAMSGTGRA